MHSFLSILRPTLRLYWTIVGIFISSVLVGLLWGLNIGALSPVIKISLEKDSLQTWVAKEITAAEGKIADLAARIRVLEDAGDQPNSQHRADLRRATYDLNAERRALQYYGYLAPVLEYLPRDQFKTIALIVAALLCGTVFKGIFIFTNLMLVARLEQRTAFDLRQRLFHQCLRLDQSAFGEHRTSGLLSQFHADIGHVSAAVRAVFGTALREPLKMTACLIGACVISPRLLMFSLIVTPITAFTIRKLGGSIKRANRRSLEEISTLFGVLTEAFQGIETVHAFRLERHQRRRFFRVARACMQKAMKIAFYNSMTKPITEFLGMIIIALALLSGAYLIMNEATHLGPIRMLHRPIDMTSLLMFFGFLLGATEPARKLADIFNSIQAGVAASERLLPLLNQSPSIDNPATAVRMPAQIEQISLVNVSFRYPGTEASVLTNVDLQFKAGETVAFVGPNGCGKTTLINLLPRFHDPSDGAVRINGIDLRSLRLSDLRDRIGMVTQRTLLFDDTVYNNIRYGRLNATQADIVRAAKQARADRFITEKLEQGYETEVGVAGENLSGGQRQRIALARALLRDPEILILDEATSQIDLESEQLVHQALEQFAKDRTVLMITHRMASLELADRVVVMNHGRVEDVGTHDDLITRCPLYQRLHELQFKKSA